MPNTKSAVKSVRTSAVDRQRNKIAKTTLLTSKRKFMSAIEAKTKDEAMTTFRAYCSVLDKTAKKGIIKANNASRKKQRAAAWLKKLQ